MSIFSFVDLFKQETPDPLAGENEIIKRVEDDCKGVRGYNVEGKSTHLKDAKSLLPAKSSDAFSLSHPDLCKYVNLIKSIVNSRALLFEAARNLSIVDALISAGDSRNFVMTRRYLLQTIESKNLNDPLILKLRQLSKEELTKVRKAHKSRLVKFTSICEELINYYYGHVCMTLGLHDEKQVIVTSKSHLISNEMWNQFHAHYFEDGKGVDIDRDTGKALQEIDEFNASAIWSKQITFCKLVVIRDRQTQVFIKTVAEARAYVLLGRGLLADMFTRIASIDGIPQAVVDGIILKLPWKDREAVEKWAKENEEAIKDIITFLRRHREFVWNMEAKAGED